MKRILGLFRLSWVALSQVYSGSPPELVLEIPLPNPTNITLSEDGLLALVSQEKSNKYSVLSLVSNTAIGTYGGVYGPIGVASGLRQAYAVNSKNNTVTILHADFQGVHGSLKVGNRPFDAILSPDEGELYVTNCNDSNLTIYETKNNTLTNTIAVGAKPEGIAVKPHPRRFLYVANNGSNTISVVRVADGKITTTINVGQGPRSIAVTENRAKVCVTNYDDGTLSVIDATSEAILATIVVGSGPSQVATSSDSTTAYVTNYNDGTLSVVDLTDYTVTYTIEIGGSPNDIAITANGTMAYITNTEGNVISVVRLTSSLENVQAIGSTEITQGQWCKEYATKLKWQGGSDVARYDIYKDGDRIAILGPNVYEYIDHGVNPDENPTYLLHIVTKDGDIFPHTFWIQ